MNTKTIPTSARDLARICCPADEGAFATLCDGMTDLPAAALAAYWEAAAHEDPTGEEPGFWGLGRVEEERREVAAQRAALHARAEQLGVLAGATPPGHLRVLADRLGAAAHNRAMALLGDVTSGAWLGGGGAVARASSLAGALTLLRDLHAELPAVLGRADEQFRARALGQAAARQRVGLKTTVVDHEQAWRWLGEAWTSDAAEHLDKRDDDAVLYRAYLLGAGAPLEVIAKMTPALDVTRR